MRVAWGAVAHVFVAVALSLPLVAAGLAIGFSMTAPDQSWLNRGLLAGVACAFVAAVSWAALLPPVRQVEVATARTLLGVDLPDVLDPASRRSRLAGAAWLAILIGTGLFIGGAVLYLLPAGVGLIAHPFTGASELRWPDGSGGAWRTGTGGAAAWVALLGLAALVLLVATVWLAARLLVRWSVPMLGPTASERLALAAERERDLARANALAREVHDTLGHTLTAMTVQVTLARRLLTRDPQAADRALAAVEEHGRRAQADVDAVVGALRTGNEPASLRPHADADALARLQAIIAQAPIEVLADLPTDLTLEPPVRGDVEAVVREGLTNAARHGRGPVTVRVVPSQGHVYVEIGNRVSVGSQAAPGAVLGADPGSAPSAVPPAADRTAIGLPRRRQGLAGLRERVLLSDGTIKAQDEGGEWWLRVSLPR